MTKAIIASTSTIHGSTYLEYLLPTLKEHYYNCSEIVFIPFARPSGISHEEYTLIVKKAFSQINIQVKGLHEFDDYSNAIKNAQGIFTGGGNTFLLVSQLYKNNLIELLRTTILAGTPYLGTSAGSNICGLTMSTTNDMPIVYPPSFKTLGIIPFNINPHYLDPDPTSTHKGETRETRIKEFHKFNTIPVVGLREGSWLTVDDKTITLNGNLDARIFECNKIPYEVNTGQDLSDLN
ncbi:dipeptidase PepE [Pseudofulvibacter geojedonensis]|uniref:Dipeptidase PepE n=1 Tax=Pseudofulvibacter geojedonensis TaxID=1123758 RepID=A0ABW3I0T7_9FLAO